jgi:hypothetical protein
MGLYDRARVAQVAELLERPPAWPRPLLGRGDARALSAELRRLSRALRLGRRRGAPAMPSAGDLAAAGHADVMAAVVAAGGYGAVASRAGLATQRRAYRRAPGPPHALFPHVLHPRLHARPVSAACTRRDPVAHGVISLHRLLAVRCRGEPLKGA